jgi:hypothetical protein
VAESGGGFVVPGFFRGEGIEKCRVMLHAVDLGAERFQQTVRTEASAENFERVRQATNSFRDVERFRDALGEICREGDSR